MELHLGIMKNQELADWFGIALKSYTNSRKKKLEELKTFASFEEIRGGVDIKEIFIPEYSKKGEMVKKMINEDFVELWRNQNNELLNTSANVTKKMLRENPDINYKESYLVKEVRKNKVELFGKGNKNMGSMGSCSMFWGKAIPLKEYPGEYICVRLTPEEEQIKNELLQKYYATKNPEEIEKKMIIKEMYNSGVYDAEDALEAMFETDKLNEDTWKLFLCEFAAKCGGTLMRTTELLLKGSNGTAKLLEEKSLNGTVKIAERNFEKEKKDE